MKKNKREKSNLIGNHQNQASRSEAMQLLDKLTQERTDKGWIWVKKGQTQKQIHPEKLQSHIHDGWKKISK